MQESFAFIPFLWLICYYSLTIVKSTGLKHLIRENNLLRLPLKTLSILFHTHGTTSHRKQLAIVGLRQTFYQATFLICTTYRKNRLNIDSSDIIVEIQDLIEPNI